MRHLIDGVINRGLPCSLESGLGLLFSIFTMLKLDGNEIGKLTWCLTGSMTVCSFLTLANGAGFEGLISETVFLVFVVAG